MLIRFRQVVGYVRRVARPDFLAASWSLGTARSRPAAPRPVSPPARIGRCRPGEDQSLT